MTLARLRQFPRNPELTAFPQCDQRRRMPAALSINAPEALQKSATIRKAQILRGADRNRTDDGSFADSCLTTWRRRRTAPADGHPRPCGTRVRVQDGRADGSKQATSGQQYRFSAEKPAGTAKSAPISIPYPRKPRPRQPARGDDHRQNGDHQAADNRRIHRRTGRQPV
jgi:hypothetical protein